MSPDDVADLPPRIARTLADAFGRDVDYQRRDLLSSGLAKLAKACRKLEASDVRPVVQSLAAALQAEKDPCRRDHLACALAPLADRLSPGESRGICLSAAESLSSDWTQNIDPDHRRIQGLWEMMIRLPTDIAARTARLIAKIPVSEVDDLLDFLQSLNVDDSARTARVLASAIGEDPDPGIRRSLAAGLCLLAEKMDPEEAARVCGPMVEEMGKALPTIKLSQTGTYDLINGFAVVASRQSPAVASRSARLLASALHESDWLSDRPSLAKGLATVAGGMDPVDAARVCGEAARVLAGASRQEPDYAYASAEGLAALAGRMDRGEAERICGEVARVLADALGRQAGHSYWPAWGLAKLAARMEPGAASLVCDSAIRGLLRSRSAGHVDARHRPSFDYSIAELLPRLEPRIANAHAAILAAMMCSDGDIDWASESDLVRAAFARVLTDTSQIQRDLRGVRMAMQTIGLGVGALPAVVAIEAEPWPCRLTTQELVNLLKMPTCYGKARRDVLNQLGNIHGRHFANHWEFVRFAHENHLSLNLTTPPRRPDPAALGALEAPAR